MNRKPTKVPILDSLYREFLLQEDTANFIRKVALRYTPATLERLASHGSTTSRRGAILALGFVGDYESNAVLGRALVDRDRGVRMLAENGIRSVWCRAGSEIQRQQLEAIIRLNQSEQHQDALRRATSLIHNAPWFAEAWNQRAIAHFQLGRYQEGARDCHQTLEINPYHFGAAAGMGHCQLKLGQPAVALESFRRALKLNPGLESIRSQVALLERTLEREI